MIDEHSYKIENIIKSQSILDILDDMDYDTKEIERILELKIQESRAIKEEVKHQITQQLHLFLKDNGYLKTLERL